MTNKDSVMESKKTRTRVDDSAPAPRAAAADTLVLVDGSSYLYRAFHAMPNLTNSRGEPTGAIYGVTNMLRKLLADYDPQYIAVVFDAKGKTFRDEVYPEYKANRPPMPDALGAQLESIHAIVEAMGLPLLQIPNVEADDVIGTLARRAASDGMHTLVSTGDKDMAQLVDGRVTLVNTMTDTVYDREQVIAKFGVPPELIVDYLALVGDSVDNIPGVRGVGDAAATAVIAAFGTLEKVYADLDAVAALPIRGAKRVAGLLAKQRKEAFLSRELARLHDKVPLKHTMKTIEWHGGDRKRITALADDLGFGDRTRARLMRFI